MKDFGKETMIVMSILFGLKLAVDLIRKLLSNNVVDPVVVDAAEPALGAAFLVGAVYAMYTYSFPAFLAGLAIFHHGYKLYKAVATRKTRAAMPRSAYCR